jgi:hypothetical protein
MQGAASSINGECWFRIGDPAAWYGQSILADAAIQEHKGRAAALGDIAEADGVLLKRVRSYDIEEIVADLPVVDYMHMDIQGTELDFLAAKSDILQERVRQVNIGTHSKTIQRDLRRLFTSLGWANVFDIPLNGNVHIRLNDSPSQVVTFGDGVQVWSNPLHSTPQMYHVITAESLDRSHRAEPIVASPPSTRMRKLVNLRCIIHDRVKQFLRVE